MTGPKLTRETRPVAGFSRVTLAGIGTLLLSQGNRERLTVEASPEMLERITSTVEGGVLTLGLRKGTWLTGLKGGDQRVLFELTMISVGGITLSGAGDIEAGPVKSERVALGVSGAGDLRMRGLEAESLDVSLSGAGGCEVDGRVRSQDVTVSGAGVYSAKALSSAVAKVAVSGAGDIIVRVSDTLDAAISGAGDVVCYGEPTVFRRVTGAGKVTCVRGD